MTSLKEKKILLICARFFGYEVEIQSRLAELGATVDYFDQRPSNSFLTKVLIRVNNKFLSRTISKYYLQIINKTKNTAYDYILFISPEVITKKIFLNFKQEQKNAQFILYMWDSLRNKNKGTMEILSLFNSRFSFDKEDCSKSNLKLKYRPLFFLNDYAKVSTTKKRLNDLLFIGTIHSDRYRILMQIKDICEKNRLTHFYYMYFPSKILYLLKRIIEPSLWRTKIGEFRFDPLKKAEIISNVELSRVVIDIQHPSQIGLTMRTIEMLGARKKLLTTNGDIVNYDFYKPENIKVISRNNIQVDQSFFEDEFSPLENEVYNKYSIDGWIADLFKEKQGMQT